MSCIHYKFRSALEYDTITFDGLSISLADLKQSIITQKKFGKNTDFDLEVTNAQTKEEYKDELTMIPKNSSVVVRRIPVGTKSKAQLAAERASPFSSGEQKTVLGLAHEKSASEPGLTCRKSGFQDYQVVKTNKLSKVADLANADASEEDKLKAMMKQSGEDWDPSQYAKGRRPYAPGVPVPQSYVCYRCGKPGHFIRNCPTNGDNRFDVPKVKRTTGIPRTFLGTVEDRSSSPTNRSSPSTKEVDSKAKGKEKGSEIANKKVPSELRCPSCNNLLTDAVLIPCCGTSYCDDCIRNYLLENEQECPSCGAENVSPDSLVINKQLRQAVNTFKNARPASPYPNQAVAAKSTSAAVANNTEVKQPQQAAKVAVESTGENAVSDSKPAENKAVKQLNNADIKTKEGSPKPAQQVTSQPQQIRVHHRDGPPQQGAGFHPGGAPFDPRRRQGDFLPRGPPRVPEIRHGISEPIIPHGLPPEHVPRVPAVRPGMGGPGPPIKVPNYVPGPIGGMHAVPPAAAIPRIPPVPTLVGAPLPHHPPFGAPMFDPLHHPADLPRSLTPPISEREFYKLQKKLKARTKKKRENPSVTTSSRPRKEPKKDGGKFDFDDELSEYRELQKSRQRLSSRSLTPSRSWSRSPSRSRSRSFSRSRSRSRSHSSPSPVRSPTPEGWDESRSPSPSPSRGQSGGNASAEEKKRKHKKRKKEQKSKGRKKQKTSHKEEQPSTEQKAETAVVKEEEKSTEKKKHKQKEKANDREEQRDKLKDVGKEKDKKEVKASNDQEKTRKKDKDKKKLSNKEKVKEKESAKQDEKKEEKKSKEGKEKKKKKDKDKKEESSSGKKRKSKKKHKKHKRHKKEKSKEEKTGGEEEDTSDRLAKGNEDQDEASEPGYTEDKAATGDELDEQETDESEQHDESDEEQGGSEEIEQERTEEKMDEDGREKKDERHEDGKESDEKLRGSGKEKGENEIDEEKLLKESDDEEDHKVKTEKKLRGRCSGVDEDRGEEELLESDKENEHEAERSKGKQEEDGSDVKEYQEKQLKSGFDKENDQEGGRDEEKQVGDGGYANYRGKEVKREEIGNENRHGHLGESTDGNDARTSFKTNEDDVSNNGEKQENGNYRVEQLNG